MSLNQDCTVMLRNARLTSSKIQYLEIVFSRMLNPLLDKLYSGRYSAKFMKKIGAICPFGPFGPFS